VTAPKLNVEPIPEGQDPALYLFSLGDQRVFGAYMDFFISTLPLPPSDEETVELVRIRNAVAQSCEY
jgi:hypothetical protein